MNSLAGEETSPPLIFKVKDMKSEITLNAYAKINLSLKVLRRRPDGYHDIRSLMQGIGLYDVIKITKCLENGTIYNLPHCEIDGIDVYLCADTNTIPADMSNLAFKGIKAVLDACNTRFASNEMPEALLVDLDKRLPVAAGIAGGSGNAAACMLGLNAMLGNPFSLNELMEIGTGVGADVPFSLMMNAARNAEVLNSCREPLVGLEKAESAAWVSGIGEIVEPVSPVVYSVIMANPGVSVSTKAAYESIDALLEGSEAVRDRADMELGEAELENIRNSEMFHNDFESYTLAEYAEASRLCQTMKNELDADTILMSGSGPTMIAYYEDCDKAKRDFARFQELCQGEANWRTWFTETGMDTGFESN